MRAKAGLGGAASLTDPKPNEFGFRVTEASLTNEQYHVPPQFQPQLAGRRLPVRNASGAAIGEVLITHSGAASGQNEPFGPKAGDLFRITVGGEELQVSLICG